jgi:hypothetical protein
VSAKLGEIGISIQSSDLKNHKGHLQNGLRGKLVVFLGLGAGAAAIALIYRKRNLSRGSPQDSSVYPAG